MNRQPSGCNSSRSTEIEVRLLKVYVRAFCMMCTNEFYLQHLCKTMMLQ